MSTTKKPQVSLKALKKIIKEELSVLNEKVDHTSIKGIVTNASELLEAIESFRESAAPQALSAVTPFLNDLEKTLENMLSAPASYVAPVKLVQKKVSLRPVKDD